MARRGTPQITQGHNRSSGWSSIISGQDARITGEIENTGTQTALNVRVTVTLRDPSDNLLGRVRNHVVGSIEAGSSEPFVVIIEDGFSETSVETSSYQVEVDIGYNE